MRDAAAAVYGAAVRTPLVRLWADAPSPEIYLKLEALQPIGSFKIRGAYNVIRQLPADTLREGVWTVSAATRRRASRSRRARPARAARSW